MTPGIRFFEPTPAFLTWAATTLRPYRIHDVGAGDGHVTRALREQGLRAWGIDLYPHPGAEVNILAYDGTRFPYKTDAAVLLCRPCHGDFTQQVFAQARRCGVTALIYVGLEKNLERDFGDELERFERVLTHAGGQGEIVLMEKFKLREPSVQNVARVQYAGRKDSYWVVELTDRWENAAGGGCPKSKDDIVHERAQITDYDFQSLDWTKTGYMQTSGDHGWLSPDGTMYYCDYMEHDQIAYYIIKRSVGALTSEGWVRVDGKGHKGRITFRCPEVDPTPAQLAWLTANGHDLHPYGLNDETTTPEDAEKAAYERYIRAAEARTGRKIKQDE